MPYDLIPYTGFTMVLFVVDFLIAGFVILFSIYPFDRVSTFLSSPKVHATRLNKSKMCNLRPNYIYSDHQFASKLTTGFDLSCHIIPQKFKIHRFAFIRINSSEIASHFLVFLTLFLFFTWMLLLVLHF